jgi:carbon monoxide dehydrogenase subunit G
MKIEANVMINRPVEEVWRFLTDWSVLAKLNPAVLSAEQTSTGPAGVGTILQARLRGGRLGTRTIDIRVIEYEPGRKLTVEHATGPSSGTRTSFTLEAAEGKTRLTCTVVARLGGFYRVLMPFMTGRARNEVDANLKNAKLLIESGKP